MLVKITGKKNEEILTTTSRNVAEVLENSILKFQNIKSMAITKHITSTL